MSLGKTPSQGRLYGSSRQYCEDRLSPTSIYRLLHTEGGHLFPDEAFGDLFQDVGRCSVPPRIVATVMTLQRIEGLSDREAVDRFSFDLRWKYGCGGLDYEYAGFVHTVLVDMRARLRRSKHPNRIFEAVLAVAKAAGLVGRKRVMDSTALYDAVATQDTVTLVRSAIRGLVRVADDALARELRAVLKRDDDYEAAGKPACDWDDAAAREVLVDALARDGQAVLECLQGRKLAPEVEQAGQLVATVLGQDLELGADGIFRIIRGVAEGRVISTVDPEARHGHKTASRAFDGYKGHVSIDPDSEIVTATEVTPGNAADHSVAKGLLAEALSPESAGPEPVEPVEVFGDSSYGTAEVIEHIEEADGKASVKAQAPSPPPGGKFSKDRFLVDLGAGTVTCPAGRLSQIRTSKDGGGIAEFGVQCHSCPLRGQCSDSPKGRTIRVNAHEKTLQRTRSFQAEPAWRARYRATRPKVERKIAHLVFRRHGGRRARVRGCRRVALDFALLAAAVNLRRLATLGVKFDGHWTT
jgi:hypothetical protein